MMELLARVGPNDLMLALGRDMLPAIKKVAQAAVREVVITANRNGVQPDELPYVFWALVSQKELPDQGPRQKYFQVVLDIMTRTGALPNYSRAFSVPPRLEVDTATDQVATHMGIWAVKDMLPALMVAYLKILHTYASKVPEATEGAVPSSRGAGYLNEAFREVLSLRSSLFEDGELLRRVLRIIPEG